MKRFAKLAAMTLAVSVAIVLVGCDGDDNGGGGGGGNTGSVTGRVVAGLENPVGFGNVLITIGGRSDRSDANGFFRVDGIAPGRYEVGVTPDPDTGFVVPPNADPVEVTVLAGQTTNIDAPITVVDENDLPPNPPG